MPPKTVQPEVIVGGVNHSARLAAAHASRKAKIADGTFFQNVTATDEPKAKHTSAKPKGSAASKSSMKDETYKPLHRIRGKKSVAELAKNGPDPTPKPKSKATDPKTTAAAVSTNVDSASLPYQPIHRVRGKKSMAEVSKNDFDNFFKESELHKAVHAAKKAADKVAKVVRECKVTTTKGTATPKVTYIRTTTQKSKRPLPS